jgi:hypothetical protein
MNIIEMIIKNKLILTLLVLGLILIGLKSVGGISECNGKYQLGSCNENGQVYN